MKRLRAIRSIAQAMLVVMIIQLATPTVANSDANCLPGLRAKFMRLTEGAKAIRDTLNSLIGIKAGRAQWWEADQLRESHLSKIEAEAKASGKDPFTVFDEYMKTLERDLLKRMKSRKTFPTIEELLAYCMLRSPSFRGGLMTFLEGHASIRWAYRWRILAHFREYTRTVPQKVWKWYLEQKLEDETLPPDEYMNVLEARVAAEGETGVSISAGRRFYELWQNRIRIPTRNIATPEAFSMFVTEFGDVIWRVNHPEPFWRNLLAPGLEQKDVEKNWDSLQALADRLQKDYRGRWKAYMEDVSADVYGKIDPAIIREFDHWGMGESILKWAMKLAKKRKEGMSDAAYEAEIENMAIQIQYVVKPVIDALFLYWTIDSLYSFKKERENAAAWMKHVQDHPEEEKPQNKKFHDRKIENLEYQINDLKGTKRAIENDLKKNPTPDDAKVLKEQLEMVDARITKLTKLRDRAVEQAEKFDSARKK